MGRIRMNAALRHIAQFESPITKNRKYRNRQNFCVQPDG